jgi:hypothetical protein
MRYYENLEENDPNSFYRLLASVQVQSVKESQSLYRLVLREARQCVDVFK